MSPLLVGSLDEKYTLPKPPAPLTSSTRRSAPPLALTPLTSSNLRVSSAGGRAGP